MRATQVQATQVQAAQVQAAQVQATQVASGAAHIEAEAVAAELSSELGGRANECTTEARAPLGVVNHDILQVAHQPPRVERSPLDAE